MTNNGISHRYRIGDAVCDLANGVVKLDGAVQRMEPRLCGVLAILIQRDGGVVTRDEFLELVWDREGSDEALTQAISRLRLALGNHGLIITVPRVGYRLSTPATVDISGEPISQIAQTTRAGLSVGIKSFALGSLAASLVILAALYMFSGEPTTSSTRSEIVLETEESADYEFHAIPDAIESDPQPE